MTSTHFEVNYSRNSLCGVFLSVLATNNENTELTDANYWRLQELVELRLEQPREDQALLCNTYSSTEITKPQEKLEAIGDRLEALKAERARRVSLSNHARLDEFKIRGEA